MEELVIKAKGGDADAFAGLYETCYRDMYAMAYRTLGNVHDAENAVSEAVLDAYAGLGKLRDPSAFRAWIFTILANKCKRQIKDYVNQRENTLEKPPEDYEEVIGQNDPGITQAEDRTLIQEAFNVLSSEERMIVGLTIYGQLSSDQIAGRLSINRSTVRSKYSRALKKMKKVLE
ncbi:MAG: RNA polymerase sigma factor [Lachnospiraceae bacterium]|nr:RNA polymerase sigma factor [Lachnospiraceae bacterium]